MGEDFDDVLDLDDLIDESVDELGAQDDPLRSMAVAKRRRQRPARLGDDGFSDDDAADGDDTLANGTLANDAGERVDQFGRRRVAGASDRTDLSGGVDALARGPAAQRPQAFGDGSAGVSAGRQTQLDYDSEQVMGRLTGQVAVPDGFEAIGRSAFGQNALGQNAFGQPPSAVEPDNRLPANTLPDGTRNDGAFPGDTASGVGRKRDEPAHETLRRLIGETIKGEPEDPFNLYRGPKVGGTGEGGQLIPVADTPKKKPAAPATPAVPPKGQPPAAAPPAQTPATQASPPVQQTPPTTTQPPGGQQPAQPPQQTPPAATQADPTPNPRGATIRNQALANRKHPVTGIPFDGEGYADFSSVTKKTVSFPHTGHRGTDFATANRLAGYPETPEGYTWHHHHKGQTMQLVPKDTHDLTGHTGSIGLGNTPGKKRR